MSKKTDYIQRNEAFVETFGEGEEIIEMPCGVRARRIASGEGDRHPNIRSVVSVHYTGRLITGRVFDDTRRTGIPAPSVSRTSSPAGRLPCHAWFPATDGKFASLPPLAMARAKRETFLPTLRSSSMWSC